MATNISNLKSVIINRIASQVSKVGNVENYERTGFDKFPGVTVICSGNDNKFWSTAQNERAFNFIIRIYEQLEQKPALETVSDNAKQRAERILEECVSQIIDAFDSYIAFGGAAEYCRSSPSEWGYAFIGSGWCRTAEVKLQVIQLYTI